MRCIRMILLGLAMLSLAACGAAPQAAAPTAKATAGAEDALATAVPAPTADRAPAPSEAQTAAPPVATATPEETLVPRTTPTTPPSARTARPTPAVARVPTAESAPVAAGVVGEVPTDLLDKILADAAQLSGVPAASIVVQVGQAVEWPDGALGCPQPGVVYLQVITPGYHVVLLAGARSYDYRAAERGRFFVCKG